MPALPPSTDYTTSGITKGAFRSALTSLRAYLAGIIGADGTQAQALITLGAILNGTLSKSGAYTVISSDRGKLIDCTGTWVLAIDDASTLGAGFSFAVRNSGTGTITVNPYLSQLVDAVTSVDLGPGESALLICDGSAWKTVSRQVFQPPTTNVIISQQLVTSGSGTLTKPTAANQMLVEVAGGGGVGRSDYGFSSSGGPAGGYSSKIYTAADVSYVIGAAGVSPQSNGGTTTATVSGVSITAGGGQGASNTGGTASGGDINVAGKSGESSNADVAAVRVGAPGPFLNYGSGALTRPASGGEVGLAATSGAMRVTWYK